RGVSVTTRPADRSLHAGRARSQPDRHFPAQPRALRVRPMVRLSKTQRHAEIRRDLQDQHLARIDGSPRPTDLSAHSALRPKEMYRLPCAPRGRDAGAAHLGRTGEAGQYSLRYTSRYERSGEKKLA